jgi:hypothetical protein
MPQPQRQLETAPLAADIYSESLDQQFAFIYDFLLTPLGTALLANDPWVRRQLATAPELARHLAQRVYRSKPFFITAPITQAILTASRSLPAYTFTAESFPCTAAYVWLQEPICLYDGPLHSTPVLLRAFSWYLDKSIEDEKGRIPVIFDGYLVHPDRPQGVPTFHVTMYLGWTLDERYGAQAWEPGQPLEQIPNPDQADIGDVLGQTFVRFAASCLSFLEQRLTIPVGRPASRASRRRVERKHATFQPESDVQVIELRRRERRHQEHPDEEGDRNTHEWHVQWLVSGHWRRHWYPRARAHKPRYIAPYVKGPQDKPLKAPSSQLFVVKR